MNCPLFKRFRVGEVQMESRIALDSPQLKRSRCSDGEWHVRVELAACYRLVAHFGLDELIFNHISARVPGEPRHILLNPLGLTYDGYRALGSDTHHLRKPKRGAGLHERRRGNRQYDETE